MGAPQILEVNDGRKYHPLRRARPIIAQRFAARLNPDVLGSSLRSPFGSALKYAEPQRVSVCLRRKGRREVLHALKRTGKGSGGGRRRRTATSNNHC